MTTTDNTHSDPATSHDDALPRPALTSARESVFAAYTAAHGHPLEHDGLVARHRRTHRWVLSARAASIVITVALALFLGYQLLTYQDATTPLTGAVLTDNQEEDFAADPDAAPDAQQETAPATVPSGGNAEVGAASEIVIHVAGEVKKPGLYSLPEQSRVADAIEAAGGVTKKADIEAHNLARTLTDGEQILVPQPGETLPATTTGNSPAHTNEQGPTAPININTASAQELQALPGIGPALAGRIVAHRDAHGPFTSPDGLDAVSGIGPAIMANVADLITT